MKNNIVWENDWANYMAMDEDERWHEYNSKPCLNEDGYYEHSGNDNVNAKRKQIIPIGYFYWKESLIERKRNTEMNSKIKTIQLHETSDNSVFRDIKEAEEHQKKVDLDELLFKNGYSKEDAMTFSNFIIENKEEITKILNRKD